MSEILKKYKHMANTRSDYNTINNINFMLPTMGEMVEEDLMSDLLEQFVNNDSNNDFKDQDRLDAAYYVEQPFSIQPGYHPVEAAFVLKVRALADAKDNDTWELNRYDGDTTSYLVNDIDDGNESFTFNDGITYRSFKDYYKKMKGSNKLTIRHAGINTPEIPHLEYQPVAKEAERDRISTMTFKELKEFMNKNNTVHYIKYPVNSDKTKVVSWKDDKEIKLLKVYDGKKTVYHQILETLDDEAIELKIPNANAQYSYHKIVITDDSDYNSVVDGYKAQNTVKKMIDKASEILLVVDANQLSVNKTENYNKTFNSLYYMTDAIDYLVQEWGKSYRDIPQTSYTYNAYGADKYTRSMGVIYIRTEHKGQMEWINLNKYVACKSNYVETNPDYNSSPELQEMKNGMSEAFKLWSYTKDNIEWLDSFNKLTSQSYKERIELHKQLTGIDFTTERNCALMIGDTMMLVPPESIRNVTQVNYEKLPNMRSKGTMAKQMGQNEHMLEVVLYFYGEKGINGIKNTVTFPNGKKQDYYMNGLRSLIAQFKIAPYLPIENGYINDVLGIEAVTLMNMNIETVKGFPRLYRTVLTLREFNYRTFMPDLPVDDVYGETEGQLAELNPLFAKCFNWEIFRYYYQRAIKAGDDLAGIEKKSGYASYDYNYKFYSHKNTIMPWDPCGLNELNSSSVSFYIPDENWLEQALSLKKERDANYTSNFANVSLSVNAEEFLTDLEDLSQAINQANNVIYSDPDIQNNKLQKAVSNFISQEGKGNKQILADIPNFKFAENPDEDNGAYIRNIADTTANFSSVYIKDGNKDIKKSNFQSQYIAPIADAYLDIINNSKYMTGMSVNEAIRWDRNEAAYKITWEFNIRLNAEKITDDDMLDIREVLSKASGQKMDKIFKDNIVKVNYSMWFDACNISSFTGEVTLKADISGKGGTKAKIRLGDTGLNNLSTNTFKFEDSYDTVALGSINTALNSQGDTVGEVSSNVQDEGIDFYIHDYKNPANMPFVPYVEGVLAEGMGGTMANSFTNISLKAIEGVGPQYLGGQDTMIELNLITDDLVIVSALNNLPMMASALAKRYKRILPAWPIKVRSALTNMLGISEVLIDAIEVSTVEGYPGVYSIAMRLTSVDRTQRQREALRKLDVTPQGGKIDYNGHSNLAMKNYFSIEQQLAQAELYPDLDIPTIEELAKLGYRYVKYTGTNRVYPDPDFYIMYNYPYTSLIIKKLVKDSISQQLINTEEKPEGEALQEFTLKDTLGAEVTAKISAYTGMSIKDIPNKENNPAATYDEILLENKTNVREKLKNNKNLTDAQKKQAEETYDLMNIMKYLTMCDVNDGWEIKPGWKATLCDESTNEAMRNANVKNVYAEDIKKRRKDALRLIDNILLQPLSMFNNLDNGLEYNPKIAVDVVNELFYNNKDGKALMELLFPGLPIKKAKVSTGSNYLGIADSVSFNKDYFKNVTPLNFLAGYTYAAGCALSGHEEYRSKSTTDKWGPNHHGYGSEGTSAIYAEDEKVLMPYAVEDRIAGVSKLSTRIDSAINNGTCFGAFRITKYSTPSIVSDIAERTDESIMYGGHFYDATYKDINNENTASKKLVKAGFLDPYYNYREDEETLNDYKRKILLSKTSNTEAFLRIMLVHLRKLILDGLLISEIDIIAETYKEVSNKILNGTVDVEIGHVTDAITSTDYGKALEELGFNREEMAQLLVSIKEANERGMCARMIYPFLTAITKCSSDIYSTLKFRDYDKLNALTGYIEGGNQNSESRSTVIKFLSALSGIELTLHKEGKNESSVSASQKLVNNLMKDVYIAASDDPRSYILHSFYDMLVNDKRGRLVRAFPTYYVVFVDEGRKIGSWKLHDNFYNMSSIAEIQVVKSRKIAADTCTITMNNMFNSYTREPDITTTQQYMDIYGLRDVFDSIFSPQTYFEKEKRIRLRQAVPDKVVLQPGIRIHVRMGYSGDGSKLPIVFNGKVAEVEVGDVAQIVAQGDGHELMNPLNAFGEMEVTSLDPAQSAITWFKDIRGSLAGGGESPRDLLAKLLTAKYGGWKKVANSAFDGRWFNDNPFGIMHFGDPKFNNIFELGEPVQNLYEVSDENLLKGFNELYVEDTAKKSTPIINTSLQDKTMWDLLHLAANTGLEYVGAIRDFGFRSTIFLGRPNHYYAYQYALLDNKIVEKRKPFQQYHYYDSYNDIIYNSIKASEAQMRTNAVGLWQSSSLWWGREQSTVGPIYLDMNIYPEYQKSMTVDTGLLATGNGGIDIPFIDHFSEEWNLNPNDDKVNKSTAWRVTANALKNSVKDMYQGDIGIIGDPSVKPYDRVYLYDTYEDMMGQFEVEAVIHTMSVETGFTTSIMPDVIARHDDKYEASVQSLMSSIGAVASLTVAGSVAETLWTFTFNNKLATSIAKSKSLYGVSSKLNNLTGTIAKAPGMKAYLEKHPSAKNLFSSLSFNPTQIDLDIRRTVGLVDELSSMTLKGGLTNNINLFATMFSKYNDIDVSGFQNAVNEALTKDTYGYNKTSVNNVSNKKDNAFKAMTEAKNNLDKNLLSDLNVDLDGFKNSIRKNPDILKEIKYDKSITKIFEEWDALDKIDISNPKVMKQFSEILDNKAIQKAIGNETLVVKGLDNLYDNFAKMFDGTDAKHTFKAMKAALKCDDILEGILAVIKGVFKFNWATILVDVALSTITHIFTKNTQSVFTRWMQGIQAIDVYPLKKNGKPLIAGMNGHKGSVYGYPVNDGYDSIQGMVLQFVDTIKSWDGNFCLQWADGLVETFVDKNVLANLSAEWRKDLGIEGSNVTGALDETSEELKQNIYGSVSSAYAANANHAYAIMTKYRKQSFDTKHRTDETYKYYEIKGVSLSNIATNSKVQKLYYIVRDDDIWKAIVDNRLVVSHSKGYSNLVTIPFEGGSEKVPVLVDGNIIETPLLQEDALFILKSLVLDENLQKGKIHFKSGARLNDVNMTWKNTGFSFTIEYKGIAGRDSKMVETLDRLKEQMQLTNRPVFAYQQVKGFNDKFVITVYPPIQDTETKTQS